jgi:NAD(P)-dependent dehydrogenase (short-subunit alcohol dehydrogenase family)
MTRIQMVDMFWMSLAIASLIVVLIYYLANHESKVCELQRKCVIITGCDSGFGHELALALDSQGLRVFAGCLTEKGQTVIESKCSPKLKSIRMDVTKSADIQRCFSCVNSFLETTNGAGKGVIII